MELRDKLAEKDTLINSLQDHITTLKVLTTDQQDQIAALRKQAPSHTVSAEATLTRQHELLTIETEPAETI